MDGMVIPTPVRVAMANWKWSAFEMVHTKKRNRLHQKKMNDLVYVMVNMRLTRKEEINMKNINPNVRTFNTLVDGLCKEGEINKARNVLAVMIKQGVEPNVDTYNSLMDGYFLVKEVNMAKYVFNTFAQREVTPDVHSYTVMINGLCKNKMVNEAVILFKEMYSKSMTRDTVTYSSLIDGLCKLGRISDVWDLIDEMHDRGQPANDNLQFIIGCFVQNHQVDKAIELFTRLKNRRIEPDVCTYTILIDGFCNCRRLKDAQQVFRILLFNGIHEIQHLMLPPSQ